MLPRRTLAWAVALATLTSCPPAHAQDDSSTRTVIDDWAEAMVQGLSRRWEGPEVEWPEPVPRPESAGVLRSLEHPVNVHVGPRVTAERAAAALAALEYAHELLVSHGWPVPWPDGGAGGTAGFDLYLLRAASDSPRPVHP